VGFWSCENPIYQNSKFKCVICFVIHVFSGIKSISAFELDMNEFELV
jgi:hypothetical protein